MARQGGSIKPTLQEFELGDFGRFVVTAEAVYLNTGDIDSTNPQDLLEPAWAPLFRMVANRLDEIAGKRVPRG